MTNMHNDGLLHVAGANNRTLVAAIVVTISSCSSSTGPPDPSNASYAGELDPPILVLATEVCDRFLTAAVLLLGEDDFDLSVDLNDDCSAGGGQVSSSTVLVLGDYFVDGTTLHFLAEASGFEDFSATFDAEYVRVTLPPRQEWPVLPSITLELGPKMSL